MFEVFKVFLTLSFLLGKYHGLNASRQSVENENENSNTRRIVNRVNHFLTILEPKTIRLEMFIALLIDLPL